MQPTKSEAKAVPEFKEEDNVLHLLGTECILPEVFADFWRILACRREKCVACGCVWQASSTFAQDVSNRKGTLCDVEIRVADSSFRVGASALTMHQVHQVHGK